MPGRFVHLFLTSLDGHNADYRHENYNAEQDRTGNGKRSQNIRHIA